MILPVDRIPGNPEPEPNEGAAFEALLDRHADKLATWVFAWLAKRPILCAVLADMLATAANKQRQEHERERREADELRSRRRAAAVGLSAGPQPLGAVLDRALQRVWQRQARRASEQ